MKYLTSHFVHIHLKVCFSRKKNELEKNINHLLMLEKKCDHPAPYFDWIVWNDGHQWMQLLFFFNDHFFNQIDFFSNSWIDTSEQDQSRC